MEKHTELANYVIVNIWTSAENKFLPGANVGHVSIETAERYMSLWPGARKQNISYSELSTLQRKLMKYYAERPTNYKKSYLHDVVSEAYSESMSKN